MTWEAARIQLGVLGAALGLCFAIAGCESTPATTDATVSEPVTAEPDQTEAVPATAPEEPAEHAARPDVYAQRAQPFTRSEVDKLESGLKPLESVETRPNSQR